MKKDKTNIGFETSNINRIKAGEFLKRNKIISALRDYGIYFVLIFIILIFSLITTNFASISNFILILLQVCVMGIISIGMLFVILTSGIDLSVGAILAVSGMISGLFAKEVPSILTVIMAIFLPLIIGLFCGLFNGVIVSWGKVPALIVTLGTMYVFRGFIVWYHVNPVYKLSAWYRVIGQGKFGPIPIPVVFFVLVAIVASIVLNLTRFGRYIYAVGGNQEAARAAGININLIKLSVYAISGFLCGLAGLVFTSRLGAAQSISGDGFNLIAIASVVVGGASIFGGRGTVGQTIVGSLIIQILQSGLVMLNVPSPVQQIIIGMIVIIAVWLDNTFRKTI